METHDCGASINTLQVLQKHLGFQGNVTCKTANHLRKDDRKPENNIPQSSLWSECCWGYIQVRSGCPSVILLHRELWHHCYQFSWGERKEDLLVGDMD